MLVDVDRNELHVKLVYYGPGLAGKSTNLRYVHERTAPSFRTELVSIATDTERMLSLSIVPQTLSRMGNRTVRVFLHTIPGTVFYDASRKALLKDADAIVFVADSQGERADANRESLGQLHAHLEGQGQALTDLPFVIQYNKQDLAGALAVEEIDRALNPRRVPYFGSVASAGVGVFDTLKASVKLALDRIPPPSGAPYR